MDQTDSHNELVSKREWLLMPGESPVTLSLNVLDAMDVTSGKGVVFVRVAPLPHARSDSRPDFRVVAGRPHAVEALPNDYRCEQIPYEGGTLGRHRALMAAERRWRAYVPGRDGLLLSNTWGDRNRDARLNESFGLPITVCTNRFAEANLYLLMDVLLSGGVFRLAIENATTPFQVWMPECWTWDDNLCEHIYQPPE